MRTLICSAFTLASASVLATPASAFDGMLELSGQFAITPDSSDAGDAISPRISAFVPITDSLAISGDMGFGVVTGIDDSTDLDALNAFLAGHYMLGSGPFDFRLGFGVAFPTSRSDNFATVVSSQSRGFMDLWLYSSKTVSLVVPARVEINLGLVEVAGDGALVWYIPEEGSSEFGFQVAGEASVGLGLLSIGTRIQLVSVPTAALPVVNDDSDTTQVSINPYLRLDIAIVYARAGVIFNLDNPAGPSFDSGRTFGVDVAVGISW